MLSLYAFKDLVVGNFDKYFVAHNMDDAQRISRVSMERFPFREDLDLYLLAKVEPDTGNVHPVGSPLFVCHVSDLYREVVGNVEEK